MDFKNMYCQVLRNPVAKSKYLLMSITFQMSSWVQKNILFIGLILKQPIYD